MSQFNLYKKFLQHINQPVDNSGLVAFRIIFGLLICAESIGAIATGWVEETFVAPVFSFTFIGFEWLQPLLGSGMYFYYGTMGALAICVMIGFRYKLTLSLFSGMWTITYLMQKSHYNNHYYLLILLCFLMLLVPANGHTSIDAKRKVGDESILCRRWGYWIFYLQLFIVFTYASIAKMNPDWMAGIPIEIWFQHKSNYPIVGPLLQQSWMIPLVAYGGIVFDGLIIPALIWKKTRKYAFVVAIVFHLFNSAVFHIGIFPYLMIGISVLFFPPTKVRKVLFRRKPDLAPADRLNPGSVISKPLLILFSVFFLIQVLLPLRHHLFTGDASWNEEGHRMAWRMMLRTKSGKIKFIVKDRHSDEKSVVSPSSFLSPNQARKIAGQPDMIWQAAQYLKEIHTTGYHDPEIYVDAKISLNGRPYQQFIDSTVELSSQPWYHFKHSFWILDQENP